MQMSFGGNLLAAQPGTARAKAALEQLESTRAPTFF
jgi:hypothetical protein